MGPKFMCLLLIAGLIQQPEVYVPKNRIVVWSNDLDDNSHNLKLLMTSLIQHC